MPCPPRVHRSLRIAVTVLCLAAGSLLAAETRVPVTVAEVEIRPVVRQVDVTGSVTSPRAAALSPATEGLVETLQVDAGDRVEKGDTLLTLDRALVGQQLAAARARVAQGEATLADARRRLKEAETLGPSGGMAETLIENIRTEVAQSEAALASARAEAAQQQTILDRHSLNAPFSGVISERLTAPGEWVAPGTAVFQLVDTDNLRLDFALPEGLLPEISAESTVSFRLNALPGSTFDGRVKAVVPVADPGVRTFLMRIEPEQAIPQMMPGLSAVARVRIGTHREAPVIPEDALLRHADGRTVVWTVASSDGEQVARERLVSVGESFDGVIAVTGGLEAGERVVVRGNESLQEGQPLTLTGAGKGN